MHEPEKATFKAKDLIRMAVAKAGLLEPLYPQKVKINQNALVIGGGLAGMTAALSLAGYGVETYLVEKEKELGGDFNKLHYTLNRGEPHEKLKALIRSMDENGNIHLFKEAKIEEIEGSVGKFKTVISVNGGRKEIEHGVIVVATGAKEYEPKNEYLYGQDERVLTQVELEEKLASEASETDFPEREPKTVVMIQCVGARSERKESIPHQGELFSGKASKAFPLRKRQPGNISVRPGSLRQGGGGNNCRRPGCGSQRL